jgi:hypothetical protein
MTTITLSVEAITVLRKRLAGERVEVTAETQPLYRELVEAGLMIPPHTFALGRESAYRLSDAACDIRDGIVWNAEVHNRLSCHDVEVFGVAAAEILRVVCRV